MLAVLSGKKIEKKEKIEKKKMIEFREKIDEVLEREYVVDPSIPKNSPITDFYRDKTVFLTGTTGFLGHLFLEKLLR